MSPRTGRPKADNPKAIRYSIRLDAETEERLKKYCEVNGITRGEAVRRAIEMLLEKQGAVALPTESAPYNRKRDRLSYIYNYNMWEGFFQAFTEEGAYANAR